MGHGQARRFGSLKREWTDVPPNPAAASVPGRVYVPDRRLHSTLGYSTPMDAETTPVLDKDDAIAAKVEQLVSAGHRAILFLGSTWNRHRLEGYAHAIAQQMSSVIIKPG